MTFCAFDKLRAFDGELVLYNLTCRVFHDGKIDIKSEILLRNTCTRIHSD